jgi:CRP-like cAMP-binding protein
MQTPGIDNLKNSLLSLTPIPETELNDFCEKLKSKEFVKGDFLCREGQVENYIFYLSNGATRNYFLKEGKDFTVSFHFENEFVSAYYSFLTREPSLITIEIIQDAEVIMIPYKYLYDFYETSKYGERIGRLIAEAQYKKRLEREMELLSLTAEERYSRLMKSNPEFIQTISVKHLSSFLGIQPESLSRIRKQYLRN